MGRELVFGENGMRKEFNIFKSTRTKKEGVVMDSMILGVMTQMMRNTKQIIS